MNLFFFYGSLVRGERNHWRVSAWMDFVADDAVAGTLTDLGEYPGARLCGESWIEGEVWSARDPARIAELDDFEGEEYPRVQVVTRGGRTAWVYENAAPGPAIPGGDWRAHLESRERR